MKKTDLRGMVFGRLTVLEPVRLTSDGTFAWGCKCECGKFHYARPNNLKHSRVTSCGCHRSQERRYDMIAKHAVRRNHDRIGSISSEVYKEG